MSPASHQPHDSTPQPAESPTILEAALEEMLRGETPPDLRDSIMLAIQQGHVVEAEPGYTVGESSERMRTKGRRVVLLGMLVGVLCCAIVLGLVIFGDKPQPVQPDGASAGTDSLGMIKVEDDAGRRVTVGFGDVEYNDREAGLELKRGFIVVDSTTPDVISEGKRISAPTGRVLVVRGEKPTILEFQAMAPALAQWCRVEPARLKALSENDTWFSKNDMAFMMLKGEADVFGGKMVMASDLEKRVQELQLISIGLNGKLDQLFFQVNGNQVDTELVRPEFGSALHVYFTSKALPASARNQAMAYPFQKPQDGQVVEFAINSVHDVIDERMMISVVVQMVMPSFENLDSNGDSFIDAFEYTRLGAASPEGKSFFMPWPVVLMVHDLNRDARLDEAEYADLSRAANFEMMQTSPVPQTTAGAAMRWSPVEPSKKD